MSRLFTLQEAEELLPALEGFLRTAIDSKKGATEAEQQMTALLTRIHMNGGITVDLEKANEIKSGKEQAVERLKQALSEIENTGVLVKDLDIGLLDFPTLLDETEVYLCWKLGEPRIGHWHHTNEGFAGRKSIDRDFRERHRGGRPN